MNVNQPTIVMVGGWSPGPLLYLRRFLASYRTVEPRNLPMPPFPGSWCCDVKVLVMFSVLVGLLWTASRIHHYASSIVWNVLAAVGSLLWFRLLAAVVVRVSIKRSAQICMDSIRRNEGNVVIIGFSWGGAVVAEMIANGVLDDWDVPPTVLIAPTTSLVASVAMEKDAALRIMNIHNENINGKIHVVHGTADTVFCPNQERWDAIDGLTLHRVPDNHVFFKRTSQRVLADILTLLLPAETRSEVPPGWLPIETR